MKMPASPSPLRAGRRVVSPARSRGASLLEVLIAVLILAIGMLGMAALQASALRNNQGALGRTQAVIQAYAILDAMRANPTAARSGGYNLASQCSVPSTATTLVQADQKKWIQALHDNINATACGAVNCVGAVCTVSVKWDDTRAGKVDDNDSARTFVTTTRI